MSRKPGNAPAAFGPGSKKMGGIGMKNDQKAAKPKTKPSAPGPSDDDDDDVGAFKRGGPVKKKAAPKKGKC